MPPPYAHGAIHFGNTLENFFHRAYGMATHQQDEIGKFLCLIYGFNFIGGAGRARSYHGTTSQVQFGHLPPWTRPNPQCELSDVLFVTFNQQQLRISFLQAKAKTTANSFPVRLENTEQYAVLSHRPLIANWLGNVVWNNDILQNAILPSVGSFGIFHGRQGHNVGFHYAVANELNPLAAPRINARGFPSCNFDVINLALIGRRLNGFYERVHCHGFADFGAALINLEIGTPIHTIPAALASLRRWAAAAAADNPDDEILAQLLGSPYFQELPDIGENNGEAIGVPYVVIIKSNLDGD